MQNQLMYLIYGPAEVYHREAKFSIFSALYRANLQPNFTIVVYTDQPQHYADLPVETYPLTERQLNEWYGELKYFHRAKLLAMQLAAGRAEKTYFIDTDTFFLKNPNQLFDLVTDEQAIADELYFASLPEVVAFAPAVAAELARLDIDSKHIPIINSGLFGLARSQMDVFAKAIALNDVMYPASNRSNTTEQLVLGMAASTQVKLAEDPQIIKHYWSRKQLFRAKALAFLAKHESNWQSADAKREFLLVNEKMPKPPALARSLAKLCLLLAPQSERQYLLESFYGSYNYANPFDAACKQAWSDKALENAQSKLRKLQINSDAVVFDAAKAKSRLVAKLLGIK